MPMPVRALLVLIHLRTNLTTRALAALFYTSQSAVDRVIHRLVPVLAQALQPNPAGGTGPWIIDGTLIPVHDQSITAISKNYRRSVNTQILICAHRRRVLVAGRCWPFNRNDVIVARYTVLQLLNGHVVLGVGGYRGVNTITTPRRDHTGRIVRDEQYRAHRPDQGSGRTHHRPAQGLANTAPMPTPRRRHQPQPPDRRRTVEPESINPVQEFR